MRGDDPPGDPIYRSCVVRGEREAAAATEWHTDAEGRTTWLFDGTNFWSWERTFDGACEVETRTETTYTAARETSVVTRTCDDAGRPLTQTETFTFATESGSASYTWVADTAYAFDADGRAVLAVTTTRGSDGPPSTTTCTYSAWDEPDACVVNPASDHDPIDDWFYAWERDADGNVLHYELDVTNPGYFEREDLERDALGRTIERVTYDTALSETYHFVYAYRDGVLDTATSVDVGLFDSEVTTRYTYEVVE